MSVESIAIWGMLPPSAAGTPENLLDDWLNLLTPPTNKDGETVYPYRVKGVDSERGVATDRSELDELFEGTSQGRLGNADGQLEMRYRDIPVIVETMGPSVEFGIAPAYHIDIPDRYSDRDTDFDGPTAEEWVEQVLDLAIEARQRTDALYSFGFPKVGAMPPDYYPTRDELTGRTLDRLYWLNIWPADIVDQIGRDRIRSAPAWRVEELDDRVVLLVTFANPYEMDGQTHGEVAEHFGLEAYI